jgi:uncharacterized protein (TIGR02147 family)
MDFTKVSKDTDYTEIIKHFYNLRAQRRQKYSWRIFAKEIGMSSSRLSQVMQKKYGLSSQAGALIADKAGMNYIEKEIFCNLISLKHARSKKDKEKALNYFKDSQDFIINLDEENIKTISDWEYFSVLELVSYLKNKYTSQLVAQRLSLNTRRVEEIVQHLLRLGYLQEIGRNQFVKMATEFKVNGRLEDIKLAVMKYVTSIFKMQNIALTNPLVDKYARSAVFVMDEADVNYAKSEILQFLKKMNHKIERRKNKRSAKLYYMTLGCFSGETSNQIK